MILAIPIGMTRSTWDRRDDLAVDRETRNPQKPRPAVRRRWGGRLFAIGRIFVARRRRRAGRMGILFAAATGHGDGRAGA